MSTPPGEGSGFEQSTNPMWFSLLCCLPAALGALLAFYIVPHHGTAMGAAATHVGWVGYLLLAVGVLLLAFVGGYTMRVDGEGVTVMLGLLALPIKKLAWSEISSVNLIQHLNVLQAFRGYGWRVNLSSSTTGYVLESGPAICFMAGGWNYVFTTQHAAELVERAKPYLEKR